MALYAAILTTGISVGTFGLYFSDRCDFNKHMRQYAKEGLITRDYYFKHTLPEKKKLPHSRNVISFTNKDIINSDNKISFYNSPIHTYTLTDDTIFESNNFVSGIKEHTKVHYLLKPECSDELAKVEYITDNRELISEYLGYYHYPCYSWTTLYASGLYGFATLLLCCGS